jgi:transcriptional regulator GlxA family with amidase domain
LPTSSPSPTSLPPDPIVSADALPSGRRRTVLFVIAAQVHLLDLAGPAQVFSAADDVGAGYDLAYVGEDDVVASHQGIGLHAGTSWPDLGSEDVVIVPGWRVGDGPTAVRLGRETLDQVVAHHAGGGRVASVCAGAFALAAAGLLDGRRATTHHDLQDEFARRFPAVRVVRDVLFVADERVFTSAGIASGIDLALHLVAMDHGPALAARAARSMVVHTRRDGSSPQLSAMLRHRNHLADVVHRAQDILDARFTTPVPLAALAAAVGVSQRTLTRRFLQTTGTTPMRYQQELRMERAEHLTQQGWSWEAAAQDVGFTDARMLRRLKAPR